MENSKFNFFFNILKICKFTIVINNIQYVTIVTI